MISWRELNQVVDLAVLSLDTIGCLGFKLPKNYLTFGAHLMDI